MKSLRRAFTSAWQAVGSTAACENCPLHKLHRLCQLLEGTVLNWLKMFGCMQPSLHCAVISNSAH